MRRFHQATPVSLLASGMVARGENREQGRVLLGFPRRRDLAFGPRWVQGHGAFAFICGKTSFLAWLSCRATEGGGDMVLPEPLPPSPSHKGRGRSRATASSRRAGACYKPRR
jgi:hypothetical protein